MERKQWLTLLAIASLSMLLAASAQAETTPSPDASPNAAIVTEEDGAQETMRSAVGGIPAPDADNPDLSASALNAAIMLREGTGGARYAHWETALGHAYNFFPLKKVAQHMLKAAVGIQQAQPINRDPVALQPCPEVPLPVKGQKLEKERDFNLHGAIYSSSALTSATATLTPKSEKGKEQTVTVTFDPAADIRSWSIDEKVFTVEKDSLNDGLNFALCLAGSWTLTIRATTAGHPAATRLFAETFDIVPAHEFTTARKGWHMVNQNLFDDNWDEAYAFFGDDLQSFLFAYYPGSSVSSQFISTDPAWSKEYLVFSELRCGKVHIKALPYFNQAAEYLKTTYVKINTPKNPAPRLVQLIKLVDNAGAFVPRFQKNQEYISHHVLGTAVDINSKTPPNTNHLYNQEIIRTEVRDNLTYDGIGTDEKGVQYYEFTYTGTARAYTQRIPNTIINYLIYELAFYRAGFSWGFYYETTCDAMHFMLTELDINKHIDSDLGLRKVYEYYN